MNYSLAIVRLRIFMVDINVFLYCLLQNGFQISIEAETQGAFDLVAIDNIDFKGYINGIFSVIRLFSS